MRLGRVAVGDFEDNGAGFPFDVVEQIVRRVQDVVQEVNSLFFLYAVKHCEGDSAAGDLGDVLSVQLEGVCVAAEGKCIVPSNPGRFVSIALCDCVVGEGV